MLHFTCLIQKAISKIQVVCDVHVEIVIIILQDYFKSFNWMVLFIYTDISSICTAPCRMRRASTRYTPADSFDWL